MLDEPALTTAMASITSAPQCAGFSCINWARSRLGGPSKPVRVGCVAFAGSLDGAPVGLGSSTAQGQGIALGRVRLEDFVAGALRPAPCARRRHERDQR